MKKIEKHYDDKSNNYTLNLNENSSQYKVLESIISLNRENLRILDGGCSKGYLGSRLKEMRHEIHGIEEAKKVLDEVIVRDIEEIELSFPGKYLDVMICADILENLFDPKSVLFKLQHHLKDDAILVTLLPNIANWKMQLELLLRKLKYTTTRILNSGHIQFFICYTARRKVFEESGFKITGVEYTFNWEDLPKPLRTGLYEVRDTSIKFNSTFNKLSKYQIIFTAKKEDEKWSEF